MLMSVNNRTWATSREQAYKFVGDIGAEIQKEDKAIIYAFETDNYMKLERTEFSNADAMMVVVKEYEDNGVKVHYHLPETPEEEGAKTMENDIDIDEFIRTF